MDFYAVLDQVLDLLRQRGRVTYNALKRSPSKVLMFCSNFEPL